jgi:hypothetical protein
VRRAYIYPHRSVRSLPLTLGSAASGGAVAVALIAVTYFGAPRILAAHERVCDALLRAAAIHMDGESPIDVFAFVAPVMVPVVSSRGPVSYTKSLVAGALASLALLTLYRFVPLARSFLTFVLTLLAASAAALHFFPSSELTAAAFSQMWLRGELLVWLLLPAFGAILFAVIERSPVKVALWMVGVQGYAVVWSAVRLAFCLGVLQYGGAVLLPMLWFCLGLLADFTYLVVAYSLVASHAAGHWGGRRLWRY